MFGLFKKKKVTYEMKAVVDGAVVPMTEATDQYFFLRTGKWSRDPSHV